MAQVYGQIESLKQIRARLNAKNIDRFESINEINDFLLNYELEVREVFDQAEKDLDAEIAEWKTYRNDYQEKYKRLRGRSIDKLNTQISQLKSKSGILKLKINGNWLRKLYYYLRLKRLNIEREGLEENYFKIIDKSTYVAEKKINKANKKIGKYTVKREEILSQRAEPKLNKLAYMRETVEELQPLIAGAKGEHLVVKEVEKLSDDYILINDFYMTFDPPIYNRKENDRIFSIQIDHLLLTRAGIFLLETKNWSRRSIERLDMRSPIKQIQRTSYALFTLLNSESNVSGNGLNWHHWGTKQIPIRNVVVMINEKPIEKFNFVAVKNIKEINAYLSYFDPIFSDKEFDRVKRRLMEMKN